MKLGEVFNAQVRGLTSEGSGVVDHSSGRVVFVPGAWIGEEVEVKIIAIKSQLAQGQLRRVIQPHPQRRVAPCNFHGYGKADCGGCPWQFMEYAAQLAAKQERVVQAVARIAAQAKVLPIMAAPAEWSYRNRAQLKTDGRQLGFVAPQSHQLAPVTDCLVLDDDNRRQLRTLLDQLPDRAWQQAAKRQLVSLSINGQMVSVNQRLPFAQGNSAQNQTMQEWLQAQLKTIDSAAPVLELFAGSGNFTRVISALGFASITAVEGVEEAVAFLSALGLPGVIAQHMDLYQPGVVSRLLKHSRAQVLVLDPPRDGVKFANEIMAKKTQLEDIFYISCDLATFSRDCKTMLQQGFEIASVQPLDLFPQTPHIELMARLKRA